MMASVMTVLFVYGAYLFHVAAFASARHDTAKLLVALGVALLCTVSHGLILALVSRMFYRHVVLVYEDSIVDTYEAELSYYHDEDEDEDVDEDLLDGEYDDELAGHEKEYNVIARGSVWYIDSVPLDDISVERAQNVLDECLRQEKYIEASVIRDYISRKTDA